MKGEIEGAKEGNLWGQLTRTHSPRSSSEQTPDVKTMHRSVNPSRGSVHITIATVLPPIQ